MENELDRLQESLGYQFGDEALLRQALRHRSAGRDNNERLEFLGDSVLSFLVSRKIYSDDPNATEATLTRKRSVLTDQTTLTKVADRLELQKHVEFGESIRGRISHKMLSDTVEAIIGATYVDGGIVAAAEVIDKLLFTKEIVDEAIERQDWISIVKERCDKDRSVAKYVTFEVDRGEEKAFQAWLTVGTNTTSGTGKDKKEAKAAAAKKMMRGLKD